MPKPPLPDERNGQPDVCQIQCLHHEVVERVKPGLSDRETLDQAAGLFRMLGDPTRLAIIQALSLDELCVCDLASLLCMSQSAMSHQLRLLRSARLVRFRRQGKIVFYRLDDTHIQELLAQGLAHAGHD